MEAPTENIYQLNDAREKDLWHEAIIVFDSSALLDLYFLPIPTRTKLFELFTKDLKDRLWIPSHVNYEYHKNREKAISNPISEKYEPLKKNNLEAIKKSLSSISKDLKSLKDITRKDDKHPHIPQEQIEEFIKKGEVFQREYEAFEKAILEQIENAIDDIKQVSADDDVLKVIAELFQVGRYYSFNEILDITKEGKHRYEFSIPPGYKDKEDKEKIGTQIFGDLIIWKQLIEYASEQKKPILFVCNDLKEDWCNLQNGRSEKRIASPREELIKEIYDTARVGFWMYDLSQFLYKLNKYFDAKIETKKIENLSEYISGKMEDRPSFDFVSPIREFQLLFDAGLGRINHSYFRNYMRNSMNIAWYLLLDDPNIYASESGVVTIVNNEDLRLLEVKFGDYYVRFYGIEEIMLSVGQQVNQMQIIAIASEDVTLGNRRTVGIKGYYKDQDRVFKLEYYRDGLTSDVH